MKLIKVKDNTYEKLAKFGNWSDTMDSIISRLIEAKEEKLSMNKLSLGYLLKS